MSFLLANVLIDLEALYFIYYSEPPYHRRFHTVVGGLGLGFLAGILVFLPVVFVRRWIPSGWTWLAHLRVASAKSMFFGSVLAGVTGGLSHILLDALMHFDMHPLWPLVNGNSLAGTRALELLTSKTGLSVF